MAHYVNITETEMDQFLAAQGFYRISLEGTVELVYGKRVKQDDLQLTLRVYTGIDPSGHSRDIGTDAIRVHLFMRAKDDRIIKLNGSKRVHRVAGWKNNLQNRIDNWLEYLPKHKCEKCGLPMVPRKSKRGPFLGCAGYPNCHNTRAINEPSS